MTRTLNHPSSTTRSRPAEVSEFRFTRDDYHAIEFDRREKVPLYAESGVAEFWIVNLVNKVVEVYRDPRQQTDGSWEYASREVHAPGRPLTVMAAEGVAIDPGELLP